MSVTNLRSPIFGEKYIRGNQLTFVKYAKVFFREIFLFFYQHKLIHRKLLLKILLKVVPISKQTTSQTTSQLAITYLKLTIGTIEQGVKYVQS